MRGRLILVGVGLIVAAVGFSLLVVGVQAARQAVRRSQCTGQLKFVDVALLNYQDRYGSFPTGAIPNPGLPPERRLSWIVASWGDLNGGGAVLKIDPSRAWDAPSNNPPEIIAAANDTFEGMTPAETIRGVTCPNAPERKPGETYRLSYVGMAGVGVDAPMLPVKHPRAGVFGYDCVTRIEDIADGTEIDIVPQAAEFSVEGDGRSQGALAAQAQFAVL